MYLIRPLIMDDFPALLEFAKQARGLTSLPKNETILKKNIARSIASFSPEIYSPGNEYYGFALVDSDLNTLYGVSAIMATSGMDHPLFYYQLEGDHLNPVSITSKSSELCSLYLRLDHRKTGVGKLLSLSRIHFLATFPKRFQDTIVANMRGFINEKKESPFWNALDHKDLDLPYDEIETRVSTADPNVKGLLPTKPLPLASLSPEAVDSIGKTHPNTLGAIKMLQAEGFRWMGLVDIIDAGPQLLAMVDKLKTLTECRLVIYAGPLKNTHQDLKFLISNYRLDFRALIGELEEIEPNKIRLSVEHAKLLKVTLGDFLLISPLQHHE